MATQNGNGNGHKNNRKEMVGARVAGQMLPGALSSVRIRYDGENGDPFLVLILQGVPTYINDSALLDVLLPYVAQKSNNEDNLVTIQEVWNTQILPKMIVLVVTKKNPDTNQIQWNLFSPEAVEFGPKPEREPAAAAE